MNSYSKNISYDTGANSTYNQALNKSQISYKSSGVTTLKPSVLDSEISSDSSTEKNNLDESRKKNWGIKDGLKEGSANKNVDLKVIYYYFSFFSSYYDLSVVTVIS